MSYEKDVKITFYNMEDGEEVSDEYSEFLMINRDGEVFELVHNGRGDYNPSYEGDWVGYKMESRAKDDEYEAKNKELLEELKYLKKVNNDLVWQRDTDEEHEAKAESYTKLVSQINAMDAIVATNYDKDMTDTNLHLLMLGAEVKRFFESGESE